MVPALETVVMSATPQNSALLFDSLTRISSMELKEGNISLTGPEYSTPTLEMPSMVTLSSAAVVPEHVQVAAVVGLHAGLGGQRGDGAGGAGGARVDGHRKLDQFVADLGLGQIGDIGGDDGRGVVEHNHGLGLGARLQNGIHAAGLARGQRDLGKRFLFKAWRGKW